MPLKMQLTPSKMQLTPVFLQLILNLLTNGRIACIMMHIIVKRFGQLSYR